MARPASDGQRVPPGRNRSTGAAVLDREETALDRLGVDKAALLDLVPQPVVVMDRDHTILYLNDAAAHAAGRTREACAGVKFWELFDNPGCRAGTCAAAQAVNTGKACLGRAAPVVQGKQISVQVTAGPVFDDRRQVVGVVELVYPIDAEMDAISKSQAVIEFNMDGTIITANDNFLKTLGYSLGEIQGRHHSMFVDEVYARSAEYKDFWARLNRGESQAAEYKRFGKGGKEIWIQASYNPILDGNGKPFKVVKYATDVTAQKLVNADYQGQIAAVKKSQALIEFRMDGTILEANDHFLNAVGYSLGEIQGRHHSMFVDEAYARSAEYKDFWARLNRGEYQAAEYKRFGKGGKEVWIQASYNPILDLNGKPFKVVKYATDVTAQKLVNADYQGQIAAVKKSQAVIEFRMDGTILDANDNFLNAVGYSLAELQGRHHSMFVDEAHARSAEYKDFWARLNRGEYQAAEYKRFGKGGKEVWIQASYNPILDLNGKPFKVVKYATDVTERKRAMLVMADYVDRISKGSIPAKLTEQYGGDFSAIRDNLNSCIDNIKLLVTDAAGLAQAAADGRVGARADADKHAGDYRKVVEGINQTLEAIVEPLKITAQNASTLASSSEELTAVSQQMAGNAEETATQANVVSAASEQVSKNVSSVASASEQMQASIREIAKNANESARVAKNAVSVAHSTNETVKKLGESSQEIGNVIKVITSIAQQTNLLALNATIEAARAGEAGKGFAVVANEVKELAKQTAKATEEISQKIEAIQGDTKGAVKAIEEIGAIINQINDISNSIASAVEEQTVTTNEIGRSVSEAAKGVGDIARNIGGVAVAAKNTTEGASDTQKAARELSQMASRLQTVVSRFTF